MKLEEFHVLFSNFVKAANSCNTVIVNQVDNSAKQSSGRPKKRAESSHEDDTGGGEEQLTEEEETSEPSFEPSPEKRPRHERVGRGGGEDVKADGGGGGGGDDAEVFVRRISAQVPVKILEITAVLAVMEKMSVRQHLMFLSGVLVACGVNIGSTYMHLLCKNALKIS